MYPSWKSSVLAFHSVFALVAVTGLLPTARAQFAQQGGKLVGTGIVGVAGQGESVALSADGNTAIVGGPNDNNDAGAAWVYTRSGGVWSQQGSKLVGTGVALIVYQGASVALSGDGNTAIVGGSDVQGAAWVYTRSDGAWSQQGSKLVGTGPVGLANQGHSVALSEDGNTALVGGPADNGGAGAAWVYTRSGGVWSQQGGKLIGSGAVGSAEQGASVALSGDGNTAIVGGIDDNGDAGAVWVYTRSNGVWSQQGGKLVGAGAVQPSGIAAGTYGAFQGKSVALSANGNTAMVGGYLDNSGDGAAWVYTRSGGVWSQQGGKLVGAGATGDGFGVSVALSGDGNTAVVGGFGDSSSLGAAWVYTFAHGVWSQLGGKLVGTGAVGLANQGTSVALSGDGSAAIIGGLLTTSTREQRGCLCCLLPPPALPSPQAAWSAALASGLEPRRELGLPFRARTYPPQRRHGAFRIFRGAICPRSWAASASPWTGRRLTSISSAQDS